MSNLKLGVLGTSRKENEFRLPLHPAHLERIEQDLRSSIFLETGYGSHFGVTEDELSPHVGGLRSRAELIEQCDVILLPKPQVSDIEELREGQVHWGWPHCVQDDALTQVAIDKKLTLIAWEAMNHWNRDGTFGLHVFHKNNELAGYCSVIHALQLLGLTGQYGRSLSAAVISYGATGRGAVTALRALNVRDVTVVTGRDPVAVASPPYGPVMGQFGADEDDPSMLSTTIENETKPMVEMLAEHDIIVNCVLQDPDDPYMFIRDADLKHFAPGTVIVDVSCDEAMGFEFAVPTSFEDPMFTVGDRINYYAVDHSPSYLFDSSTWEVSEAVLPHLRTVMQGPGEWDRDPTISKAIEIRDGVIQNPKILSFQDRSPDYPHPRA